jgi:cell filamentation protein
VSLENLAAWRAYFWPGTEVLRNKLNLRDADAVVEAEALLTRVRIEEGVPAAPLTPAGYCAIHQHIFQDIYEWAGRYRAANMRHPNHAAFFCKPEFIAGQMAQVFATFETAAPSGAAEQFAATFSAPLADLNAIHPFREGNGRAMRVFIDQLARRHGLRFDQTRLNAEHWNEASRESFATGLAEPMREVLTSALLPL